MGHDSHINLLQTEEPVLTILLDYKQTVTVEASLNHNITRQTKKGHKTENMATTRPSLGQIKEEGKSLVGVQAPSEHGGEENDVVPDELEAPKQRRMRDGKSRKRSVFSPIKGLHSEKATFTLVRADHPSASQASQVSFAADIDYSNRRISGQESHTMHPHGLRATYQIGPRNPFSVFQVEKIIRESFENAFIDDTETRPKNLLCKHLT